MAKFTVEFNEKMDSILEEMAKQTGVSKAQLVRQAIALMKFIESEREQGHRVMIGDEQGKILKEVELVGS